MYIHYKFQLEIITDEELSNPSVVEILKAVGDNSFVAHKGGHSKQYISEDQAKALVEKWGLRNSELEV